MQLYPHQDSGSNQLAHKLASGKRKIIYQLATGGGKTALFSVISDKFHRKSGKNVLIVVHREELMRQTRQAISDWCGINAYPIVAGNKFIPPHEPIYVAMVETLNNRLKANRFPANIGMLIIDECHLANFHKIHEQFPTQYIVGFSATPISARRNDPLKNYYEDIVCGPPISQLIKDGHLVQNITRNIKGNVDRKKLKMKGGDFDEIEMAREFNKPLHITNTVDAYERYTPGTKTLVFNCNIEHSKLVTQAFVERGYNARHIDGSAGDHERKEALMWLKTTPDAILNNVGILTTGFDEPSTQTIIVNRSTASESLWIQITGRGSRTFPGKDHFAILDMGANAVTLGDWNEARDWSDMFRNPPKPKKGGVAPVKDCPACDALIHASAMTCMYCGHEFPRKEIVDAKPMSEMEIITSGVDIDHILRTTKQYKPGYPVYAIGNRIVKNAREIFKEMTDERALELLENYFHLAEQWHGKTGNRYHPDSIKRHLIEQLKEKFRKWETKIPIPLQR